MFTAETYLLVLIKRDTCIYYLQVIYAALDTTVKKEAGQKNRVRLDTIYPAMVPRTLVTVSCVHQDLSVTSLAWPHLMVSVIRDTTVLRDKL